MSLLERLKSKRGAIVSRWIEAALPSRDAKSVTLLLRERDPFNNPIGTTIRSEIGYLFDALLSATPTSEIVPHLNRVIQIRSIQDGPVSKVTAFVFELKHILGRELEDGLRDPRVLRQCLDFHDRIDRLALLAFDSHARFQRSIADIRLREAKARVATLLRMARIDWNAVPTCASSCAKFPGDCKP